jgi:hypothetical protein
MISYHILDVNAKASKSYAGMTASVVGQWLTWEFGKEGLSPVALGDADVVFVVFAGSIDWRREVRRVLKRAGIPHDPNRRADWKPYIITGGPVDATPFTALEQADALVLGEAYQFIRDLIPKLKLCSRIATIDEWIEAYPHALTRTQVMRVPRDQHLLAEPVTLGEPDTWVDWEGMPPVKSDDNVVRIVASKGCHFKCGFCATTYRQPYSANPNGGKVAGTLAGLAARGERVQLLSNDPMNLHYFKRVATRLDSQSFTISELRDVENRNNLIKNGIGIARFGVEGLSERIRRAFGKPVADDELVDLLGELHDRKVNTHMFYITSPPFETKEDWSDFRLLWTRLAQRIRWGICRLKFTAFIPAAPAPLARYIPGNLYIKRQRELQDWVVESCASKHLIIVPGRTSDSQWENVAEQFGMPKAWGMQFADRTHTTDMAPDLETARRLPWEIVRWPIPVEKRYKVSDVYRKRMTGT